MPVNTYRCENCGVRFERQQKFTDQPLTRCPECNKKTLHKVYTPVGIIFKGSGFYATDHKSPSGAPRSQGNSKQAEDAGKKSETPDSSGEKTSTAAPATESKKADSKED